MDLSRLSLGSASFSPGNQEGIRAALSHNTTLKGLRLPNCHLRDGTVPALCQLLRHNQTLQHLWLNNAELSHQELSSLCEVLSTNNTLEALILSQTRWTPESTDVFCKFIQSTQIKVLLLQKAQFSPNEVVSLCQALQQNGKLVQLDLSNATWSSESLQALCHFLQNNGKLKALGLCKAAFSPRQVMQLSLALSTNMTLRSLILQNITWEEQSHRDLCQFVANNNTMAVIEFVYSTFTDSGLVRLLSCLHDNTTLEVLSLYSSTCSDAVVEDMCRFLRENKTLKRLNMLHCKLTDTGVSSLLGGLVGNSSLRSLDMRDSLSDACMIDLGSFLKENRGIEQLQGEDVTDTNLSWCLQELRKLEKVKEVTFHGKLMTIDIKLAGEQDNIQIKAAPGWKTGSTTVGQKSKIEKRKPSSEVQGQAGGHRQVQAAETSPAKAKIKKAKKPWYHALTSRFRPRPEKPRSLPVQQQAGSKKERSSQETPTTQDGRSKTQVVNQEAVRQQRVAHFQNMTKQQQSAANTQTNRASPKKRTSIIPEQQVQAGLNQRERSEMAKELSIEERLVQILNSVLEVEVRIQRPGFEESAPSRVLLVSSTDFAPIVLAVATDDMKKIKAAVQTSKLSQIFEKCAKEYGNTTSFGCQCWSRCDAHLTQGGQDGAVTAVLQHVKELSVNLILTCLTEESEQMESKANFSKFLNNHGLRISAKKMPTSTTKTQELLECISNCDQDGMKPELLEIILSKMKDLPNGYMTWVNIIRSAGVVLGEDHRMNEHYHKYAKMLDGLKTLFKSPAGRVILRQRLTEEVEAAKQDLGSYFERESVFGPLLAVTSIPASLKDGIDLKNPKADMWTSLKGFPRPTDDDVRSLWSNMSKGRQLVNGVVATGLKEAFRADPQVTVAWLSYMVAFNELRTNIIPRINFTNLHSDIMLSDGFMLNVCYVLLDLCGPFCGDVEKIAKIDPSYTMSPRCLLGYSQEPSLAGGLILAQEENHENTSLELPLKSFNFMTHIFHITLRAINIGFMPSLQQYSSQIRVMIYHVDHAEEMEKSELAKGQRFILSLQWKAQLTDYDLLEKGTRFYLTVCLWISHLLNKAKEGAEQQSRRQEQLVLQQVPEFVIKDMAHWFTFMSSLRPALLRNLLNSLQVGDFIDMCMLLLTRRDLLPGPIPAAALCRALLACIDSSQLRAKDGWVVHGMSSLESAMHSCVHKHKGLCPGLVQTYISVDVVEGLDVDRDEFDKFTSRSAIGRLLAQLWCRTECKQSIIQMCGSKRFQSFLGAILDTLLYQLHDSLARLSNVQKLELTKPSWNSLPPEEQSDKTEFLRSEERIAKGLMSMATETIALFDVITKSDEVAKCLTIMPLAKRAASALLGFIESQCGSKSADFRVKDMKKYNWQPSLLLLQLTGIVMQIVKQEQATPGDNHFTTCMATDPDFNPATLTCALQVLEEKTNANKDFLFQFRAFMKVLCDIHAVYSERTDVDVQSNWKEQLNRSIDQDQLDKVYQAELAPLCYDTAAILETHTFQSNAETMPVDARSKRCRALMKETRTWMVDLPVQAHAAIFLRQDEERMDVVRAMVTGPHDTPYSLGCFVFDIYFPPSYPDIPPLVKFTTTGGGTVRFNPNLYADGKVCLSLLGTWHGGDVSQKWQTGKSSLYQLLLSIQGMILISAPMYNEPGYEGIQGTTEGDAQSHRYNAKLKLLTLRHAVLSQMIHPPKGFEKVIKHHFYYVRDVLKKQCHDWLLDVAEEPELQQKMEQVVQDLCMQLDTLTL